MHKKLSLTIATLCAMVLFGAGCGSSNGGRASIFNDSSPTVTGDICSAFPSSWVAEAIGHPIVKSEASKLGIPACRYFLEYSEDFYKLPDGGTSPGGKNVNIIHESTDIETIKRYYERSGRWENGEGFAMDALLMYNGKGHLTDVDILIGHKDYIRVDYLDKAMTEDELIAFAKKVAEYIKSGKAHGAETSAETSQDASNKTGSAEVKATVESFFSAIGQGDPSSAVDFMDANQATKDMWKQNFSAVSSLSVKSLEPVYQSEWTAERESYKAVLEVKVKSGDAYGWENGANTRWITMQKSGGKWLVHEIANNP